MVLLGGHQALVQTYMPLENESTVKFTIKNFGFGVAGSFKNLKGIIVFDPANSLAQLFRFSGSLVPTSFSGLQQQHTLI